MVRVSGCENELMRNRERKYEIEEVVGGREEAKLLELVSVSAEKWNATFRGFFAKYHHRIWHWMER